MTHSFGSFNPNFYGISLAYDGQDVIDAMGAYAKELDLDAWEAAQDDFDPKRLGVLSAPDHELRHFHDFLLSPYACLNMIHRLQATANGSSAVDILAHMSGVFLPTPITRWLGWSEAQRADWFERTGWYAGLSGQHIVPFPVVDFHAAVTSDATPFSEEKALSYFAELSEHTARAYISLEQARARQDSCINIGLSATDMFEATAHLTQAVCIYKSEGRKALEPFNDYLFGSDQQILKALQFLFKLLLIEPSQKTKRILELFTWTLLGHEVGQENHPVYRFCLILYELSKAEATLTETLNMPTADFWDLLDRNTRQSPWRKNLADALAHAQSCINYIEQNYRANGPMSTASAALVRVARLWEKDMAQTIETVTADPGAYCDLETYVMHGVAGLPQPFVLVHYGRGKINSLDDFEDTPTRRNIFLDAGRQDLLYYISSPPAGWHPDPADLDAVADLYKRQKIIDFLFYEEATTRSLDQYYFKQGKLRTGKVPLHVF